MSARPRNDSAASCSPAAQPSVRSPSAATSALRQVRPCGRGEQLARLAVGEPQVRHAQLDQPTLCTQPGQRQRRVAAACQRQAELRRQVVQQERDRPVHVRGLDHVVVVDHQEQALLRRGQIVDQCRDGGQHRCRSGIADQ